MKYVIAARNYGTSKTEMSCLTMPFIFTLRNQQRMKSELPSKQAIEKELAELESVLVTGKDGLPVVFCHGDLCPANITFDPLRRSATFAAPEYAGANYQAFELAQHFLSMAGADLSKVGREEFVPAKEFQMRWCRAYLGGYKNLPEHKVGSDSNYQSL